MELRIASTPEDRAASFRLRYEVYVKEFCWYADKYPGGEERDIFDEVAVSILCVDNGAVAGTVRIIPETDRGLPVLQHISRQSLKVPAGEVLAEGSRMIVARDYRGSGLARRLYVYATDVARQMGITLLIADALLEGPPEWNAQWKDFLHAQGFRPVHTYSYSGPCGEFLSQVMVKKL